MPMQHTKLTYNYVMKKKVTLVFTRATCIFNSVINVNNSFTVKYNNVAYLLSQYKQQQSRQHNSRRRASRANIISIMTEKYQTYTCIVMYFFVDLDILHINNIVFKQYLCYIDSFELEIIYLT